MKKLELSLLLSTSVVIILFFFSCMQQEKVDVEADIAAINELYDQYVHAANTDDLDLFISTWDDDAIRLEPGRSSILGKENIRAFFKTLYDQFNLNIVIYGDTEIQVSKDMAFGRGTATLSLTPKEGGSTTHLDLKWLDILKKQEDGSWKIYRDMINFNEPPKVE